ncbi:lysyl-tRNA synthetase [Fibrobacteres bacterium R8-0-B4]
MESKKEPATDSNDTAPASPDSGVNEQMQVRIDKIPQIREAGFHPYAERFERTHTVADASKLPDGSVGVRVAGRVVSLRYFGKLAFGHIYDIDAKLQFSIQKNVLGDAFDQFKNFVDIGDFVGIEGDMVTTKTGEKTVSVKTFTFLSKTLRPLPEKHHGLTDPELRLRRRYLDLITSQESRERFLCRTKIIRTIRNFLDGNGFTEIDTPALTNKATGALARPFVTHNNALGIDVYLRIAPETYLKRAIAGGFDRVYEFARSFRNEGVDASHLPDFTLLEYYAAYWNYVDNMEFTEKLMKHLLTEIKGSLKLTYENTEIDFGGDWPRISFRDLILRDCGIDIDKFATKEELQKELDNRGMKFETDVNVAKAGRGTLIDLLYKKVSRPALINPIFITHHPLDLSPLARSNDDNPQVVDRFQLVVNGWEVVNAYSELVDPIDQAERFRQQAAARAHGDTETMDIDNDFLLCMEYGMPPISGWGMGIDRIVALLTNAATLRDAVLFPLLRPENN